MLRGNASRHTAIDKPFFRCPNCDATYHVVKAEVGPESTNREITCRTCGGPLPGRDGNFVIKYFPLRKAGRTRRSCILTTHLGHAHGCSLFIGGPGGEP